MATKQTKFERDCLEVSKGTEVDVFFCYDEPDRAPYEDDGSLHVIRRGVRAIFDVSEGQTLEAGEQNANTQDILTLLGMEKYLGSQVLVEDADEDDEDDCCPHCGR